MNTFLSPYLGYAACLPFIIPLLPYKHGKKATNRNRIIQERGLPEVDSGGQILEGGLVGRGIYVGGGNAHLATTPPEALHHGASQQHGAPQPVMGRHLRCRPRKDLEASGGHYVSKFSIGSGLGGQRTLHVASGDVKNRGSERLTGYLDGPCEGCLTPGRGGDNVG